MPKKKYKGIDLFCGIGGFRLAMNDNDVECVFSSDNDKFAQETYKANFGEVPQGDIKKIEAKDIPSFDILTAGFPCQPFSYAGEKQGFNDEIRGTLFFDICRILKYHKPPMVFLENVKGLKSHEGGKTLNIILEKLHELGYYPHWKILSSLDYGLPQKRNRVLVFARKAKYGDFDFSYETVKRHFDSLNPHDLSICQYNTVIDVLAQEVEGKYYLSDRIKPTILSNGSGNFVSNSDIDQMVARPLTASMHKMHRACQDNYYSDIFIHSHGEYRPSDYMTKEELAVIPIRKLTPKEAFMLQGFPRDFALNAQRAGVANGSLYKQAGNAVSVNTIYAILHYLIHSMIMFE